MMKKSFISLSIIGREASGDPEILAWKLAFVECYCVRARVLARACSCVGAHARRARIFLKFRERQLVYCTNFISHDY